MSVANQHINRYRQRSLHLLQSAIEQMREGRWSRSEDLIWGSLTLAVKGVALSRGEKLKGDEAVRKYAQKLGLEKRDHRIREAFDRIGSLGETLIHVWESQTRVDHLFMRLEDVKSAVERLWSMVPNTTVTESEQDE